MIYEEYVMSVETFINSNRIVIRGHPDDLLKRLEFTIKNNTLVLTVFYTPSADPENRKSNNLLVWFSGVFAFLLEDLSKPIENRTFSLLDPNTDQFKDQQLPVRYVIKRHTSNDTLHAHDSRMLNNFDPDFDSSYPHFHYQYTSQNPEQLIKQILSIISKWQEALKHNSDWLKRAYFIYTYIDLLDEEFHPKNKDKSIKDLEHFSNQGAREQALNSQAFINTFCEKHIFSDLNFEEVDEAVQKLAPQEKKGDNNKYSCQRFFAAGLIIATTTAAAAVITSKYLSNNGPSL